MTTEPFPTLDALVAAMNGAPTTNGWDAVSSYSIAAINQILASADDAARLPTAMAFSVVRTDPITDATLTVSFDLTLATPALAFGDDGTVALTMPITGTYAVTGGTAQQGALPACALVATVPLASAYGDGEPSSGANVVGLDAEASARVYLHLRSGPASGTTYAIVPAPAAGARDLLATYVLPLLQQHFAEDVTAIDYTLATHRATSSGSRLLIQPRSFVFASSGGVLSVYIQDVESGTPQGAPCPAFAPNGLATVPMAAGFTTSLVVSEDFLKRRYLEPALVGSGTVEWDDAHGGRGLHARFYANAPALKHDASYGGASSLSIDTLKIDYAKLPYTLVFEDRAATIEWSFSQTLHWATTEVYASTNATSHHQGTLKVSIALPKAPPITVTFDKLKSDVNLNVQMAVSPAQYEVTLDGKDSIADKIDDYLRKHPQPALMFDFGTLDFSQVTHLLSPALLGTFDATVGARVAADLLFVGTVQPR